MTEARVAGRETTDETPATEGAAAPDDDRPTGQTGSPGSTGRSRRSLRELAVDGAVVFGLAGLAVTQPVLDIFGRNPMFFVAGGYGRRQIVAFALVVAVVPGLVVWAASAAPGLVHRTAGTVLHRVAVAALAGVFALVVARTLGIDGLVVALALAVLVGVGVAAAEARWRPARQLLTYLALSNVVFLALFMVGSPTAELLRGGSYADAGDVVVPPLDGPVTVIIFDEFPLASILRPDGTINGERYPNLAALASESTWFRNASTESPFTAYSVPSILSGLESKRPDLPILNDFPRNLFTIFNRAYPVHRFEAITDLCPPEACGRPPAQPLSQALDDASLVYRHQVLPESWRESLPPVDQGWGGFEDVVGDAAPADPADSVPKDQGPNDLLNEIPKEDRGPASQVDVMLRQARLIDANPSLNVIHVLVPHLPYVLTPWGTVGTNPEGVGNLPEPGEPQYDRGFAELFALQSLQIGAIDRALGEVVAHLKASKAWKDGTFVVVSDHGRVTSRPGNGRTNDDGGAEDEVLRVPLFIKAPGQTKGEVRDDPASTVDVLPSLVDLLGIETDWSFDGHSLYDGSEPTHDRLLKTDLEDLFATAEWEQSYFPHGDGWVGIAGIGPRGDLVGTSVSDHEIGAPSSMSWSLDDREALDDPSETGGKVPVRMTGTIGGADGRPDDLVVALDGRIAGTIGARERDGDDWTFSGILGPPGARGEGEEVTAYEVDDTGRRTVLHPLDAS